MSDTSKWKQAGGDFSAETFDIKAEKNFEGIYLGLQKEVGDYKQNLYSFTDAKGKKVVIWGSTVLDRLMLDVAEGDEVSIEYLGSEKNDETGRTFNNFKVLFNTPEPKVAGDVKTVPADDGSPF